MSDDTKKHIKQKPLRLKGLPADLREKLKEARISRGWSQRELGGKIGLPQPHISAIESGDVVPRFDTLLDIVRVLELDLLLVPRSLVPAVQSLIREQKNPAPVERASTWRTLLKFSVSIPKRNTTGAAMPTLLPFYGRKLETSARMRFFGGWFSRC
jgi:transcriptional regulator with XRE-family HTH domain